MQSKIFKSIAAVSCLVISTFAISLPQYTNTRHIWFSGGNWQGWQIQVSGEGKISGCGNGVCAVNNGTEIDYYGHYIPPEKKKHAQNSNRILLIDPKGVEHAYSFDADKPYVNHSGSTGNAWLNNPVDGDITIAGPSW